LTAIAASSDSKTPAAHDGGHGHGHGH